MLKFTVKKKDGNARTGVLKLNHGTVKTPELMAVATRATVRALSVEDLEEIGAQIIIANTYHLMLKPGAEIVNKLGGVNKFMNWKRTVVTDSGGFQAFSLGLGQEHAVGKMFFPGNREELSKREGRKSIAQIGNKGINFRSTYDNSHQRLTPIDSIKRQHLIGSDVILVLDECTSPLSDKEYTAKSLERTHKWAKECLDYHKASGSEQAIGGILQGGVWKDLREKAAKYIGSMDFDYIAIGGSLGKSKKDMYEILDWVMPHLPDEKPRHLLGIGVVEDIFEAVERGVDLFDCVSPTRIARNKYAYVRPPIGTKKNKYRYKMTTKHKLDSKGLDPNCKCKICRNYSRAYIYHLLNTSELLGYNLISYHNVYFMINLMKEIREAIASGKFKELKKEWGV
jgi:queuine tRNA-ribosyltransferase/7-cyano-7-deazaguanine tRNA-ribosyltransferase